MTAPTLDRSNRTGRRRDPAPSAPTVEHHRFAVWVAAELAARRPVVVEVAGEGRGWYALAVDAGRREFAVWRGGETLTVSWSQVRG